MKYTDEISRLYLEEVDKRLILDRHTSFQEVLDSNTITVYHSCSFKGDFYARISSKPDKNIHAGSLFQAVWRADYKVNDEEAYPISYIYELVLKPERIYNELIHDSGENVDQSHEDQYKENYDLLVYHNTGEGHANEANLSVIILDHNIIKSVRLYASMNGEEITKYMEENN
jgi:hypothetical protein